MADKSTTQGDTGGDSPSVQGGTAGGEIHNMRVSDVIAIADRNNINVDALKDLIGDLELGIEAGNIDLG